MSRKYEAIDLMKLYSLGNNHQWNKILTECFVNRDINRLLQINYQLQVGMDDLARNKLNNGEILLCFSRWTKSLEDTAKKILKVVEPSPLDDPIKANDLKKNDPAGYSRLHLAKKQRDLKLAAFKKKQSF